MRVRIFFLLAIFIFQNHISAQNFLSKDSTNSTSKFQLGIGGYLGTHMFTNDKQLKNLSGYDNGLFIKALYNFNKKINPSIDLRFFERTVVVNFNDDLTPEVFQIKANGFEAPVIISYKFLNKERKEIFSFFVGSAYQFVNYQTSYDLLNQNQWKTTNFIHVNQSKTLNNFSAIFGIKKDFRLTKKSFLSLFNEYDFSLKEFYIEDITNDPITSRSWFGDYYINSFCVRLGCCVIL